MRPYITEMRNLELAPFAFEIFIVEILICVFRSFS